jgi:hypothetical protein
VKNHKIGKNSKMTKAREKNSTDLNKAREKICTDLKSLEF